MMDGSLAVEVDGQEYLVGPIAFPLGDASPRRTWLAMHFGWSQHSALRLPNGSCSTRLWKPT